MKYLLDPNVIIDFLKGKREIVKKLESVLDEEIAISVIWIAEYFVGAYKSTRPRKVVKTFKRFILENNIKTIDVDSEIAKIYAQKQAELEKGGRKISGFDMLIAATCLQHGLELVTENYRHFARVQGLKLLT